MQKRRRIEGVIGQLVKRYGAKRTWTWDLWHLMTHISTARCTVTRWLSTLTVQIETEPLQFHKLLARWKLAHRVSHCLYMEGW